MPDKPEPLSAEELVRIRELLDSAGKRNCTIWKRLLGAYDALTARVAGLEADAEVGRLVREVMGRSGAELSHWKHDGKEGWMLLPSSVHSIHVVGDTLLEALRAARESEDKK